MRKTKEPHQAGDSTSVRAAYLAARRAEHADSSYLEMAHSRVVGGIKKVVKGAAEGLGNVLTLGLSKKINKKLSELPK